MTRPGTPPSGCPGADDIQANRSRAHLPEELAAPTPPGAPPVRVTVAGNVSATAPRCRYARPPVSPRRAPARRTAPRGASGIADLLGVCSGPAWPPRRLTPRPRPASMGPADCRAAHAESWRRDPPATRARLSAPEIDPSWPSDAGIPAAPPSSCWRRPPSPLTAQGPRTISTETSPDSSSPGPQTRSTANDPAAPRRDRPVRRREPRPVGRAPTASRPRLDAGRRRCDAGQPGAAHQDEGPVRRPLQAPRRVPRPLHAQAAGARAAATAASTSRAATRSRCSTATASTARTTTAAGSTRSPSPWSTPARPRPSGRATTSTSPPRSSRTARRSNPARISVVQNGVTIHEDVADPHRQHRRRPRRRPGQPGPIMLQDHGNPVQYRNIWLLPLP